MNMKRILSSIIALVAVVFIAGAPLRAAADTDKGPAIKFEVTSIDLGNIRESDGIARTSFKFTNTGTSPLVILKTMTSCGCTRAKGPEQPVPPGAGSAINVTFNPAGRQGEFIKTIIIRTNIPGNSYKLKIKGCVIPADKSAKTSANKK